MQDRAEALLPEEAHSGADEEGIGHPGVEIGQHGSLAEGFEDDDIEDEDPNRLRSR